MILKFAQCKMRNLNNIRNNIIRSIMWEERWKYFPMCKSKYKIFTIWNYVVELKISQLGSRIYHNAEYKTKFSSIQCQCTLPIRHGPGLEKCIDFIEIWCKIFLEYGSTWGGFYIPVFQIHKGNFISKTSWGWAGPSSGQAGIGIYLNFL